MKIKHKELLVGISEYIIAALFVLECRSIYNNLDSTRNTFWLFSLITLGLSVAVCVICSHKLSKKRLSNAGLFIIFIVIYYFVYLIFKNYNTTNFFHYLLSVALIAIYYFLFCHNQSVPKVLLKYNQLICILAAISLFLWIFGSVLRVIPPTNSIRMNWVGTGVDVSYSSYFNLLYEIQDVSNAIVPGVEFKNTGIFVEAPMYALHLSLALIIELFLRKETSKTRTILLIGTIITTFSTSGYLLAIVALCVYEFFVLGNHRWKRILLLVSPIVVIGVAQISFSLLSSKLENLSGLTRIDDFKVCWEVFKIYPLFGAGFDNYRLVQGYMSTWRQNSLGISSSLMMALSYCGLYLTAPYIVCMVRGILSNKNIRIFTLFLIFLWIITVFPFQYITTFLLFFVSTQADSKGEKSFDETKI